MASSECDIRPIRRILIANRAEIARRIIRTCRKMGIESVAVFSDADKDAPHVREADMAVYIGGSAPSDSYLNMEKLLAAAKNSAADAIHPGYGFLAENAVFAQKCLDAGLRFIGPPPAAIAAMGSKSEAKALMRSHNVPVVPGKEIPGNKNADIRDAVLEIGFPALLKASAGGGGKGMRIVENEEGIDDAIQAAKREAMSAFADDQLIVERFFPSARHIEFQVFGDAYGNYIHLLERECSIQRRHQKIIEESPSPVLNDKMRAEMARIALKAIRAIDYQNAGTVEFIWISPDEYYFLEVNTRLQVEHPVTEMITGLDLVQMQIRIAEGRPIELQQDEIKADGYAVECRLYAEDAEQDFMPAAGSVIHWEVAGSPAFRIDSGVESGSEIPVHYDPMIAKLIAHGENREEAFRIMEYGLKNLICSGLTTNQDYLIQLFGDANVQSGEYDTRFVLKYGRSELGPRESLEICMAVLMWEWQAQKAEKNLLRDFPDSWRNSFSMPQFEEFELHGESIKLEYRQKGSHFDVRFAGQDFNVEWLGITDTGIRMAVDGLQKTVTLTGEGPEYYLRHPVSGGRLLKVIPRFPDTDSEKIKGGYAAPMPGTVVKVLVSAGQDVRAGEGLIVLSSMKMENTIVADADGKVEEIFAQAEQSVETGFVLLKMNTGT